MPSSSLPRRCGRISGAPIWSRRSPIIADASAATVPLLARAEPSPFALRILAALARAGSVVDLPPLRPLAMAGACRGRWPPDPAVDLRSRLGDRYRRLPDRPAGRRAAACAELEPAQDLGRHDRRRGLRRSRG